MALLNADEYRQYVDAITVVQLEDRPNEMAVLVLDSPSSSPSAVGSSSAASSSSFSSPSPSQSSVPLNFIFVHGSCATMKQFFPLIHLIHGRGHRCVAYDFVGCLFSPLSQEWYDYSTDSLTADLYAFYRTYSLPDHQNIVIGHSFGSSQVMRLAAEYGRDAIRKREEREEQEGEKRENDDENEKEASEKDTPLLLARPKIPHVDRIVLIGSAMFVQPPSLLFTLPVMVLQWMQPMMRKTFLARAYHQETRAEVLEEAANSCDHNDMYMCKAFYRQFQWAPTDIITSVTTPALLIHGASDNIVPLEGETGARSLCSKLSNAELYIVDKGAHQVMQERPDECCDVIFKFLGKQSHES